MKKEFLVGGMSCVNCKKMVENSLNAVEGINLAEVNLDDNSVSVDMQDNISVDLIKSTIESAGFDFNGEK